MTSLRARADDRAVPERRMDAFVAASTFVAGVVGYGFSLVLSQALGPSGFGELSALLAVAILATVPGTALQAGIARSLAATTGTPERRTTSSHVRRVAVGVGIVLVALAPVLREALGIASWASVLWLAAAMVPTTICFGYLGIFQGRRRFVAFGALLVAVQAAKLAAGVFAAATGTGVSGALGGTALLTALVALGARFAAAAGLSAELSTELSTGLSTESADDGAEGRPEPRFAHLRVLTRDGLALFGVLALSNLDLILARHYLPSHEAGLYAAGNLVTKAAFWGASFTSIVSFPRLSRADERPAALRNGFITLAALVTASTAGAAVCAPVVTLVIGHAYRPITGLVWLFALQGGLVAVAMFAVYAGLAVHRTRAAVTVWVVAVAECAAVAAWHGSPRQILMVMIAGSTALLIAVAAEHRRRRDPIRVTR